MAEGALTQAHTLRARKHAYTAMHSSVCVCVHVCVCVSERGTSCKLLLQCIMFAGQRCSRCQLHGTHLWSHVHMDECFHTSTGLRLPSLLVSCTRSRTLCWERCVTHHATSRHITPHCALPCCRSPCPATAHPSLLLLTTRCSLCLLNAQLGSFIHMIHTT